MVLALGLLLAHASVHGVIHHASIEWVLLLHRGLRLVLIGDDATSDYAQGRGVLALPLLVLAILAFQGARDALSLVCC